MKKIGVINRYKYHNPYNGKLIGIIEESDVNLAHPLGGTCNPCDIGKYVILSTRFITFIESNEQVRQRMGKGGTNEGWKQGEYTGSLTYLNRIWSRIK